MTEDLGRLIGAARGEILDTWRHLDSEKIRVDIQDLEREAAGPDFWANREKAEKDLTRLKRLREKIEPWEKLVGAIDDLGELYELARGEADEGLLADIERNLEKYKDSYRELRVLELLSGELDGNDAFLTIHSGAGGTEACDWTGMLLRMYTRWIERRGFRVEIPDMLEAEGGVKSVTLQVSGDYAYGYLKGETGIHRLVRISPFDSNARRHTSFASVYVSPLVDDDIEVEIRQEDLRVDTYRSSGAGGQHVNKTDSAVRFTHLPTGIVVACQTERSQIMNRATAMKMLKSRLYEYYREQRDRENAQKAAEKKDISWGNQIRSYVFQPYQMVKDLRTRYETSNIQAVMDGYIDTFIEEYLRYMWQNAHGA
ncbi:MAG: peptide chain release factor 2 [Spirochaetales bacterium]|nr:peptide chain release factor 2 [Spirochaetales bacterium]